VKWCRDEGASGANGLDSRVGLLDAFGALKDGMANGLVVFCLDRLARELVLQETLLAEIWRLKCEVFSTSAAESEYLTDDPDDPGRKFIRQVLGAVAEYEKSKIALRLRAGRRLKAERGGYAGFGSPPLGYRAEDGELVVDDEERRVVARIVELQAKGASLRSIASTLTKEGLRPKRGGRWHPETIAKVLRREGDM
jgi:DNA invertase Pin-like site-specific DNA recombinase